MATNINNLKKELDFLFSIDHGKALVHLQLIVTKAIIESDRDALDVLKLKINKQLFTQLVNQSKDKLNDFLREL